MGIAERFPRQLSRLWSDASTAVVAFDLGLANRCFIKGQGWLDPDVWTDSKYKEFGVGIDDMRKAFMEFNERQHARNQKPVPDWFSKAGVGFAIATFLTLLYLLVGPGLPAEKRFLFAAWMAFCLAASAAFLGGTAVSKGTLKIPFMKDAPVQFSAVGGIGIFVVVFLILVTALPRADSKPPALTPVPVSLVAVREGTLQPEVHTIFTVSDSENHLIRAELEPDYDGVAKIQLFPGKYELRATGAPTPLAIEVSPTNSTFTIEVADQGAKLVSAYPSESVPVTTGSSHSAFDGDVLISVISNNLRGDPATRKVSFTVGVKGGDTRTYKLQDVGAVVRLDRFEIRLADVPDWGANFLVYDKRHVVTGQMPAN